MLQKLTFFIRKLSWFPGMAWTATWLDSMYSQAGQYDQIKGDMEARAQGMSGAVTDPFGDKAATPDGEDAEATAGDAKAAKGKAPAQSPASAQAQGMGAEEKSGLPPQYRARRTATRASCMMFVFLFVLVGAVWAVFFLDAKNVPWSHAMSWWRIAAQVTLVFTIPFVLHRAIRIWLEGTPERYPDIQYSWDYGLRACEVAGVSVDSVPLYLIIGSESDMQELAIHTAAKMEYRVAGFPVGPAALHWYVTPDAIYLYATEVGWTSSLATPLESGQQSPNAELPQMGLSDGIAAPNRDASDPALGRTVMSDSWEAESGFRVPGVNDLDAGQDAAPEAFERTLVSGHDAYGSDPAKPNASAAQTASQPARSLDSAESTAQLDRLRYLSRLIRNIRSPLCPLNGLIVMVPHHLIDGSEDTIVETQKAISADLEVVQEVTQIRCPVTTLITGMEQESGFCEFIRRVGPHRALMQRFGKKFDLATRRTENEIQGFNVHLVGAFEDWVYTLFRERDALSKPGNTGLYELLGNVRCAWKPKMERLLTLVFSDPKHPYLFSGCYFAATGATPDRQAFVRAVFDKLTKEQELLEWTSQAAKEDRRIRLGALLGYLLAAIATLAFGFRIGQLWQWW